jgi:A/G-specific adenine glycosylase
VRQDPSDFSRTEAPNRVSSGGAEQDPAAIDRFCRMVWEHYRLHGRKLPWRETRDPYAILVSEVMLQQTPVKRVLQKYEHFLELFPDVGSLSEAPFSEVLAAWMGLGYNRRALALHQAARRLVLDSAGRIPDDRQALLGLPGVGPATASAVCIFAFDQPLPLIETNIRSAFLHHFFSDRQGVRDRDLLPLVHLTLPRDAPRPWYYALMDYGAWVKAVHGNPGRGSAHYSRQSAFPGSRRELRAAVLRVLLATSPRSLTPDAVHSSLPLPGRHLLETTAVLQDLAGEGLVCGETLPGEGGLLGYRLV